MKPLSRLRAVAFPLAAWAGLAAMQAFGAEEVVEKLVATNAPAAGHSLHGEAFNEGPRQSAHLIPGTGKVKFKITSKHPQAQAFFNQGVGQLHGFWYFEAERSFRQALALDSDCVMCYWGMAMANANNANRAKDFIKKAAERKDKVSPRERAWIEALAAYH